ncbi:1-acyl-sn-glycerol-3-phosphate acyltransferase [Hahella chejuensis KCTC 2396]|uniref:1-acyl-sn-glycerol-3-phosphate acyltransferase n=1 Tax=Hahella chejuensis (strain KCTC 2396) TaxID=349521 RepID=Q2SKE5_HAHCH|nr:acyltransferase [Hahella chejuensis]ABC28879.1 1-acyl-sn-glycerol-3-phosphate acyltransferase [Hahella chejuensis KCTC 2396]
MLSFLPAPLVGCLASLSLAINTIFWCTLLYIPAILKLIIPIPAWRRACTRLIILISEAWIACNSAWMKLTQRTQWKVEGLEELQREGWYLVVCNHQSWVDIFAMQHVLNRRIPFLKFFLKKELIWVPVIGLAWWGLDFPFMSRHTPEQIAKHPELKGKDMETTRKACEKFRTTPVSVMNFVEGTRFTKRKHERQQSPYQNLLKPKLGGVAFVLSAMGEYIPTMVDITIHYPGGAPRLRDFMCGRVPAVEMYIRRVTIPEALKSRNVDDEAFKQEFKEWMTALWREKDAKLTALKQPEQV